MVNSSLHLALYPILIISVGKVELYLTVFYAYLPFSCTYVSICRYTAFSLKKMIIQKIWIKGDSKPLTTNIALYYLQYNFHLYDLKWSGGKSLLVGLHILFLH